MKTLVMTKEAFQLVKTTRELPEPLNLAGFTSLATSHSNGPTPVEKTANKDSMENIITDEHIVLIISKNDKAGRIWRWFKTKCDIYFIDGWGIIKNEAQ